MFKMMINKFLNFLVLFISLGGNFYGLCWGADDVITPFIVGGGPASPGEFPWIVSLRVFGRHICGGSIVNFDTIVTAAHCSTYPSWYYTVVAGDYKMDDPNESSEQYSRVTKIIKHPNYSSSTQANDIAIMKLTSAFALNQKVKGIKMAPKAYQLPSMVTVAGWGAIKEGGPAPNILQKVTIPIVSNAKCKEDYGPNNGQYILASMFCAGSAGKDSCQGDSGGPVMCNEGQNRVLCGIVSFGIGCARPNVPGVNTRVSSFYDWIEQNSRRRQSWLGLNFGLDTFFNI